MEKIILSPSILSADFSNLGGALDFIKERKCEWVHIDVMDGIFVPNITIGEPVVAALRKKSDLFFDVHLMIENPENHVRKFIEAGADAVTFHYEAALHHHRIIEEIHSMGKLAGISIVPSTPVSAIEELLPFVDIVLVMTVNPGFGGQKIIDTCVKKVTKLAEIRKKEKFLYKISVDGGINADTIKSVIDAGVDITVSGSAFFANKLKWE